MSHSTFQNCSCVHQQCVLWFFSFAFRVALCFVSLQRRYTGHGHSGLHLVWGSTQEQVQPSAASSLVHPRSSVAVQNQSWTIEETAHRSIPGPTQGPLRDTSVGVAGALFGYAISTTQAPLGPLLLQRQHNQSLERVGCHPVHPFEGGLLSTTW
jgi:hypothetical protein